MGKSLFIAEKPSVAQQFADAISHNSKQTFKKSDGYIESSDCVVNGASVPYPLSLKNLNTKSLTM